MRGEAVLDTRGVVHRVQGRPEPFTTMIGGLPGMSWCGVPFYDATLGLRSCSLPHARPMTRTEAPVSCMACLVRECL